MISFLKGIRAGLWKPEDRYIRNMGDCSGGCPPSGCLEDLHWDMVPVTQVYTFVRSFGLLLTEAYRPADLSGIIMRREIKRQVISWINQWKRGEPTKKALLLFGPPGVGKTTLSMVLAREMGFPLVEINSSEKRNREAIDAIVTLGGAYGDLTNFEVSDPAKPQKMILVDEADNIFEGQGDTGGLSALGRAIAMSRNPIIITMNEYYDFKRRQGAQNIIEQSLVIEFKPYGRKKDSDYREFRSSLARRMRYIADREKLDVTDSIIEKIIDSNELDMRAMLNDLESIGRNVAMGRGMQENVRDQTASAYNVTDLSLRGKDPAEAYNLLMDSDLSPEDYLLWLDKNASMVAVEPSDLDRSYELLSIADRFIGSIIRKQHYAFRSYATEVGAHIGSVLETPNPHYTKYEFPSFIIGMSRARRTSAERKSLSLKYGRATHSSAPTAMNDFWLLSLMRQKNKAGFEGIATRLSFSSGEIEIIG